MLRLLFLQPSGSSEQPALLALAGQPGSSGSDLWAFTSLEVSSISKAGIRFSVDGWDIQFSCGTGRFDQLNCTWA